MKNIDFDYDVIIIGAEPSGLFCAFELSENSNLRILVIDKGKDILDRICPIKNTKKCMHCSTCQIM
ncbi:NAD(P)-binding protein [Methanococcus vannielii]|uniref:NAD(P)-binding protein n=1 Tax=Methanococcus vannielii TaxID=2187 RepID=UPI0000F0BFCD|nr:NAD(P)/FAD-dependent oxidoreductase [Methanococcus vannielii]